MFPLNLPLILRQFTARSFPSISLSHSKAFHYFFRIQPFNSKCAKVKTVFFSIFPSLCYIERNYFFLRLVFFLLSSVFYLFIYVSLCYWLIHCGILSALYRKTKSNMFVLKLEPYVCVCMCMQDPIQWMMPKKEIQNTLKYSPLDVVFLLCENMTKNYIACKHHHPLCILLTETSVRTHTIHICVCMW